VPGSGGAACQSFRACKCEDASNNAGLMKQQKTIADRNLMTALRLLKHLSPLKYGLYDKVPDWG
jgi:hypothetical protein